MEVKSIKTFIIFVLAFVGFNSLFIKMSNKSALIIGILSYSVHFIFDLFKK